MEYCVFIDHRTGYNANQLKDVESALKIRPSGTTSKGGHRLTAAAPDLYEQPFPSGEDLNVNLCENQVGI